jgi:hypothetical protein
LQGSRCLDQDPDVLPHDTFIPRPDEGGARTGDHATPVVVVEKTVISSRTLAPTEAQLVPGDVQWLGMTALAATSYILINYTSSVLSSSASSIVTAFCLGLGGNLYAKLTNR